MKVRTPVARMSGRAMAIAPRRRLVLSWRSVLPLAARASTMVVHRHSQVNAWWVDVHVAQHARNTTHVTASVPSLPATPRARSNTNIAAPIPRALPRARAHRTVAHARTTRMEQHTLQTRVTLRPMHHVVAPPHAVASQAPRDALSHARTHSRMAAMPVQTLSSTMVTIARAQVPPAVRTAAPPTTTRLLAQRLPLVWQTRPSSRDPAAARPSNIVALPTPAAPGAHAAPPGAEIATAVAAGMRNAAKAAWAAPDRASLDRLTDEVMRRVEKNLRIERERRGR